MIYIAPEEHLPKHNREILFLNGLIVDLKLQMMGDEAAEPITMLRLNQATEMLRKLQECKDTTKIMR